MATANQLPVPYAGSPGFSPARHYCRGVHLQEQGRRALGSTGQLLPTDHLAQHAAARHRRRRKCRLRLLPMPAGKGVGLFTTLQQQRRPGDQPLPAGLGQRYTGYMADTAATDRRQVIGLYSADPARPRSSESADLGRPGPTQNRRAPSRQLPGAAQRRRDHRRIPSVRRLQQTDRLHYP